jgi:hypothetical protein
VRVGAAIATAIACGALAAPAGAFEAGASRVDIAPPAWTTATDAAFVPTCGTTAAQVAELWPGPRQFAFEKPYIDSLHLGRFAPGDPYCDADLSGRYEAPYLAGGSGQNRWPTSLDPGNGPQASAIVLRAGTGRDAIVSVDSIGLFDVTMEQIRQRVLAADPAIEHVFISSTHDESAPDPIGLWGPNTTEVNESSELPFPTSSGVDQYYMRFLAERVASAVVSADHARRQASLYASIGSMPSNTQSCWSSYPYIDDQRLPVMQARDGAGDVIFTLADVGTHAETLAFSHVPQYTGMMSADWPGKMRADLEARWPGSVGVEVAGMVGSVETPTVYEPESTQVQRVPGPLHGVPGNPDGCSSVYPNPTSGTPVSDAHEFLGAYGQSVADAVSAALGPNPAPLGSTAMKAQQQSLCVSLENNYFAAAFAAGLFPERPRYSDSGCTIETKPPTGAAAARSRSAAASAASSEEAQPNWLKSAVGVLTVGPVQLSYSPGEVFPFTETRGPIDEAQMPFPTNCYEPNTESFTCGTPLPMTPWTSAQMTRRYRFLVGLGEDMIGYMFPPGNFVGGKGEVSTQPWVTYENTSKNEGHDRFGHGHADDAESVGPYSGLDVTDTLQQLLSADGRGSETVPGLYVDATGHLSDSPFASEGFSGAIGVEILRAKAKKPQQLLIGTNASGWAMFDGMPDPGTAGTGLAYSVSTGGVTRPTGGPLLVDVYAGARALGG